MPTASGNRVYDITQKGSDGTPEIIQVTIVSGTEVTLGALESLDVDDAALAAGIALACAHPPKFAAGLEGAAVPGLCAARDLSRTALTSAEKVLGISSASPYRLSVSEEAESLAQFVKVWPRPASLDGPKPLNP